MKDIKTADEFREAANKHADMLTEVYEATKAERDAATFHLSNMQNNRDSLWTENQRLVEQRDAAQHSLSNAINDRDFVMEQLATARAVAKTDEHKILGLRVKLDTALCDVHNLNATVAAANNKTDDLRVKLSHQCDENEALRATAKAIAEKRDELQGLIITHTKKYADLQSYINEVVTARNAFNRQLQEMSIERTNLRTEVNKLQNLHTNQRETILQLQAAASERAEPTQQELMDRASDDADRIREINRQLGYAFNSIGIARNELSKLD